MLQLQNTHTTSDPPVVANTIGFQTKNGFFIFSETVVMDQLSELSVFEYHTAARILSFVP